MAFNFNGNKNKSAGTFDLTQMGDMPDEHQSSGGFSGFSPGAPDTQGSTVTDLANNYGRGQMELPGFEVPNRTCRRGGSLDLGNINPKVWIIGGLILLGLILVIVFKDAILSFFASLISILITIGIFLIIFRIIFPLLPSVGRFL